MQTFHAAVDEALMTAYSLGLQQSPTTLLPAADDEVFTRILQVSQEELQKSQQALLDFLLVIPHFNR